MVVADDDDFDPHLLDEDAFVGEVQSFEFWFGAVEGYLTGRPYGRSAGTPEIELDDIRKARLIATLCNYCLGETAALEGASGLVRLAPNHHAKVFMATQVVDEARHLEVFLRRLEDLGVTDTDAEIRRRANPALVDFKDSLLALVDGGEWGAAVFAQNVILESMEFTVFQSHAENADPITAEVLQGVISDERRHFGFGENDLGRRMASDPGLRPRLQEVKGQLDAIVLSVFEGALDDLEVPVSDRPRLGQEYLETVERLGLT